MKKLLVVTGILGLVVVTLVVGSASLPAGAADHLDAPGLSPPGGDTRLDINDVYAFQSPEESRRVVLIMTVNPLAGVLNDGTFHPKARYEFLIDNDGDAKPDLTYRIRFSEVDDGGVQQVKLDGHGLRARGNTGEDIRVRGRVRGGPAQLHAGLFDDPFFFDLNAFLGTGGRTFCDGGEANFFLGLNTSAIVLEVPSVLLVGANNGGDNDDGDNDNDNGDNNNDNGNGVDTVIGVWARTVLNGKQIDRMGRPAINTVFIPNNPFEPAGTEPSQKNAFNAGKPKNDQRDFRAEVVDTLEIFYGAGAQAAQDLANILLPDILTLDTASSAGFLNGRRLDDDVIDIELGLVTNGAVPSDCVENDSDFEDTFPYLAPAN